MNIFILDTNINKCARYHCDQHVVKMILESAQLLCTALHKKGFSTPYKPTHLQHPCVLWVEASYDNFLWLKKLTLALNAEYRYRYRKPVDHKSVEVVNSLSHCQYEATGRTAFVQVMPENYRVPGDAVTAYRRFYVGEKLAFARWTRRKPPAWLNDAADAE